MQNIYSIDYGFKMNKYQEITEARALLELPERATIEEIKSNYRRLMRKWHPDHAPEMLSNAERWPRNCQMLMPLLSITAIIINTLLQKRR